MAVPHFRMLTDAAFTAGQSKAWAEVGNQAIEAVTATLPGGPVALYADRADA